MRNKLKILMKRKRLEYVSVGEKSRIDKYNEEVRGWTSSSKNPERPRCIYRSATSGRSEELPLVAD